MKVLVIYENFPESTDAYIVDVNLPELEDLKLCHGNYLNAVDAEDIEKALNRVSYRLGSKEHADVDGVQWCGLNLGDVSKWHSNKIDSNEPINVLNRQIELVIITGFVM